MLDKREQTNRGESNMKIENEDIFKSKLVYSIRESIKGPSFFAEEYWDHIKKGGDPDVF